MEQLVDDYAGYFDAAKAQQIGEQRVVEKSQAGKRYRRPHHRVISALLHLGGLSVGAILVEVAAIGDSSDDRKPPGIGLERVARRRHHDPCDRSLVDLGDAAVGVADVESEAFARELAHLE